MRRHFAKLLGLMAASSVLVLWLAAAPLAAAGGGCHNDAQMPPTTTENTTQIKLMSCAFAPTVAHVATGSTVSFFNGPDFTHLITGSNREWGSPDVEVRPNKTVTYTFPKAGIYAYACALHSGMSGVIVVGDVASTSAGGTTAGTTTGTTGTTAAGSTTASAPITPATTSPIETVAIVIASALAGAVRRGVGHLVVDAPSDGCRKGRGRRHRLTTGAREPQMRRKTIPMSRIAVAATKAMIPNRSGSTVPYVPSSPTTMRISATMMVRAVGAKFVRFIAQIPGRSEPTTSRLGQAKRQR